MASKQNKIQPSSSSRQLLNSDLSLTQPTLVLKKKLRKGKCKNHHNSGFILDGVRQAHFGIPEYFIRLESVFNVKMENKEKIENKPQLKQIHSRTENLNKNRHFSQEMNEIKEPEKRKLKLKHKINKKMFALKNYQLELVSKIGRKNTAFIKHNFQAAKLPTIDNPYLLPAVERFRDYKQLKSIKLLNGSINISKQSLSTIRKSKNKLSTSLKTNDSRSLLEKIKNSEDKIEKEIE